jgi:hypothetical protein
MAYRVILTEVAGDEHVRVVFESAEFGQAIKYAWQLVNRHGFPAGCVDILREHHGLWVSLWEFDDKGVSYENKIQ